MQFEERQVEGEANQRRKWEGSVCCSRLASKEHTEHTKNKGKRLLKCNNSFLMYHTKLTHIEEPHEEPLGEK